LSQSYLKEEDAPINEEKNENRSNMQKYTKKTNNLMISINGSRREKFAFFEKHKGKKED